MSTYQEDVNDGLTDEERAALAYEEPTEEPADVNEDEQPSTASAEVDEAATGEVVDDAVAAADPAVAEPDAAVVAAAEPAVQAPAEQPAAEAKPQAQAQAPILIVQAPEDAEAKLKDIESQKEALTDKWEAGDITNKDYQKQIDALNDQRIDIKMQLERANIAQQLEAQRVQNQWVADCNAFLVAHPEYQDAERQQLLSDTIKAIAAIPRNQSLSNAEALAKAHRMVQAELGETSAPQAQVQAPAKTAPAPTVKKPDIPPNIATLPAAAMNETQGGEFAAIETLRKSGNVEAYEEALDKLSDAARNRYLRA